MSGVVGRAVVIGPLLEGEGAHPAGDDLVAAKERAGIVAAWVFSAGASESPEFPLPQSLLDHLGSDMGNHVANLELGLVVDLAVGLGGEQIGDVLDLGLDDFQEAVLDPVVLVALFGIQPVEESRRNIDPPRPRELTDPAHWADQIATIIATKQKGLIATDFCRHKP
jgi:hypothetical protein